MSAYRHLKSGVAGLCLLGAMTAAASADIRTFNTAVQAGDYRTAAAEAAAVWQGVDRAAPNAAEVAREFGWIAMLAGEPATALTYAKFLMEQGARLAHPDAAPAVSRVLHDWASLAAVSSAPGRNKLYASLQERARTTGRDLISARAAQVLYADAWGAGEWALAGYAAELAIRFIDEAGAGSSPARFELRRGMAASAFMREKSAEAYNAVYDVAGELHNAIAAAPAGQRERLAQEYYRATAWGDVMYGALGARQKSTPDRSSTITAGKPQLAELLYPAPGDLALPRCRIVLAKGFDSPGFPFVSRFRDLGGAVTYALDVMPNGAFANPRLLAASPHAGFAAEVDDVISTWRWKQEGGAAPPNCRMPQTHILSFQFDLGR